MNETNIIFEVENYRKGTVVGTIELTNGTWSTQSEELQGILDTVLKRLKTDEDRVEYFSTHTNAVLSFRRVNQE